MNNGNTGDFDLSLIDPAALQEVQVVYGIAPSSLIGPNTIGGGVNIVTLQPSSTPHALAARSSAARTARTAEPLQSTGTDGRFGYAFSLHAVSSSGSVNQSVLAPPAGPIAPPPTIRASRTSAVTLRATRCSPSCAISSAATTATDICSSTFAIRT